MVVLTITADYDGYAYYDGASWYKNDTDTTLKTGTAPKTAKAHRSFMRFSLADLPANANITQVRLYLYVIGAISTSLVDVHAYGTAGQEDPQADDAQTAYGRCASGNLYVDDTTAYRTTGGIWVVLGGSVIQDILNAKNAVNRFSLAIHEEGDDDYTSYASLENTDYPYPAKLEITYEAVGVPRFIGDGLSGVVVII
jgi:hypothetical protein